MATISQRIELEGGEEIRRQLEALGRAGKASFDQLQQAGLVAAQSLNRVVQAVARVEVAFASVGASARAFGAQLSAVGNGFGSVESGFTRIIRQTTILSAALAGAGFGLTKLLTTATKSADEIGEQAASLGISTDAYQQLSLAAVDAGVSQEQFARGLTTLNKALAKDATTQFQAAAQKVRELGFVFPQTAEGIERARQTIGRFAAEAQKVKDLNIGNFRFAPTEQGRKAADALRNSLGLVRSEADKTTSILQRLGISAIDPLTGKTKSLDAVFIEFAEAFSKLPDGPEKIVLLEQAFGRFGRRFADLLNKGGPGIQELGAALTKLKFSEAQIETSDRFQRSLLIMQTTSQRTRDQLAILFAPAVTRLMDAWTASGLRSFEAMRDGLQNIVENQIEPIIKDLVRLLNGDEANIQNKWILEWRDNVVAFGKGVAQVFNGIIRPAFNGLVDASRFVADALNSVFGTQFTGPALLATAAVLKFLGVFTLVGAAIGLVRSSVGLLVQGLLLIGRGFAAVAAAGGLLRFIPLLFAGFVGLPALVGTALIGLAAVFLTNRDKIVKIWEELKPKLSTITKDVVASIQKDMDIRADDSLFSWISRSLKIEFENIKKDFVQLAKELPVIFAAGLDFFAAAVKIKRSIELALFNLVREAFAELGRSSAVAFIGGLMKGIGGGALGTLFEKIVRQAVGPGDSSGARSVDEAGFSNLADDAKKSASSIGKDFSDMYATVTFGGKNATSAIGASLGGAMRGVAQATVQAQREVAGALVAIQNDASKVAERVKRAIEEGDPNVQTDRNPFANIPVMGIPVKQTDGSTLRAPFAHASETFFRLENAADGATNALTGLAKAPIAPPRFGENPFFQAKPTDATGGASAFGVSQLNTEALQAAASLNAFEIGSQAAGQAQAAAVQNTTTFNDALAQSAAAVSQAGPELQAAFSAASNALRTELDSAATGAKQVEQAFTPLTSAAQELSRAFQQAISSFNSSGGGGFAGGGWFRGKPGRDTNPAWLTDKEFVMQVPAVRKYGLGFMRAINAGQFRLPKFNLGGLVDGMTRSLVPFAIPGFDTGGPVEFATASGGRRVSVDLDLRTDRGHFRGSVLSDRSTAEALLRFAADKQLVSGGRRPSSYGGR